MNSEEEILKQLRELREKIDGISEGINHLINAKKKRNEAKRERVKPAPLTEDEIRILQERFKGLYERFTAGHETAVQEELEAMTPEDLRRLADANNLNVTSKTAKGRVIQLIGFRFREKRQLTSVRSKQPGS
jgi:SMC interacting uncharacterized protein involved in chromosome segregation